ncbi:putative cyclin-dependent kinase F-2 [Aegilops tauschii subsp. strangulata]|uniref:putative cyclin-dependent kinase F-2 n=1 Tax=Aegilops tauschii subsp. strangulata TaxID=200361 RepID=UPI00098AE83D|nr:putative cyclin-dependent kinase F-2 [Aegilops tauschii subsp. strangulata]
MATMSRAAAAEAAIGAMMDDHAAGSRKRRRIGSTDDYELTRVLGAGGFGVVVKARHRATGEDVALKFLVRSPDGGGGKRRRHRAHAVHRDLLREACYLAACRGHPSVVGLHGIARDPRTGQCSLVLEHVGPSLAHVLRARHRPFTEEETRRVMRQLLSGAGRMHERGIVHRDIKPGNVLVGGEGLVKICDLGLAVSMAGAPPPRGRAGTRWYMAPEILLGRPDYDELVDTWSLGCVMAELLASEPLFPGQNAVDQLFRIFRVLGDACVGFTHTHTPLAAAGQMPPTRRGDSRLRELFPEERLSRDGFEVLDGLLRCDPSERLPAAVALQCPWFTGTADFPAA